MFEAKREGSVDEVEKKGRVRGRWYLGKLGGA
jgi:hypothetical protein